MQNEKLMILKMLEDGKISAAEASRLLQSVESGGAGTSVPPVAPAPMPIGHPPAGGGIPAPPTPSPYAGGASTGGYAAHGNNGRPPAGHHSGGGTHGGAYSAPIINVDELGRKFESFAREMAPKVQKATEYAVSGIATVADKISGALAPDPTHYPPRPGAPAAGGASQAYRSAPAPRPVAAGGVVEKNIEMLVDGGSFNELNLVGLNGEVRIKGYNGDKITARLSYRTKRAGAEIELMKLGNKYFLKYDDADFTMVSIDAYVPERAFGVVKIDGMNCKGDCSSMAAGDMRINNANGATTLSALAATNLTAETSNGHFSISNTTAENATLENMNGPIDTAEIDIANLKLVNYNGSLSIIMSNFSRYSEYLWNVETGNAKLNMNLPTMPDLGYHIKAHAAMGEIKLGLTGLQFLINEPSLVEARSTSFDAVGKKVKLAVETSNAPLIIN